MIRTAFVGLVFLAACAVGCDAILGIDQPIDRSAGSDAGTAPDTSGLTGTQLFLGMWQTSTGAVTVDCPGSPTSMSTDMVVLTVSAGTTSDLVFNSAGGTCPPLSANINGDTATLLAGQTCNTTIDGVPATISYSLGTFVVSPNGATGTVSLSGTVGITSRALTCTVTEVDPYTKISN